MFSPSWSYHINGLHHWRGLSSTQPGSIHGTLERQREHVSIVCSKPWENLHAMMMMMMRRTEWRAGRCVRLPSPALWLWDWGSWGPEAPGCWGPPAGPESAGQHEALVWHQLFYWSSPESGYCSGKDHLGWENTKDSMLRRITIIWWCNEIST